MFNCSQVTRTYSGRQGCMCGCKGKYTEADARGFKAMRDKILRMAVRTDVDVDYTPGLGLFVEVESETGLDTGRTYALYVD